MRHTVGLISTFNLITITKKKKKKKRYLLIIPNTDMHSVWIYFVLMTDCTLLFLR